MLDFDAITARLAATAEKHDVKVLYACESGSRAWGFASPDSDFDLRFIYVHRRDWYLSIEEKRDVIEEMLPNDLDLSGWELRKALRLFRKSNPPLLEWISSPIVYAQNNQFVSEFKELMTTYYSPSSCFRHYLHMAEGNFRTYLQGDTVWTKKYLYVLRPLLACRWIEQDRGPAPTVFADLFPVLENAELLGAVKDLVARKMQADELSSAPRVDIISNFIESEIPRLQALPFDKSPLAPTDKLNELFRRFIW